MPVVLPLIKSRQLRPRTTPDDWPRHRRLRALPRASRHQAGWATPRSGLRRRLPMTRGVMRRRGVARDKPRQAGLRSGGGTGVVCGIAVSVPRFAPAGKRPYTMIRMAAINAACAPTTKQKWNIVRGRPVSAWPIRERKRPRLRLRGRRDRCIINSSMTTRSSIGECPELVAASV